MTLLSRVRKGLTVRRQWLALLSLLVLSVPTRGSAQALNITVGTGAGDTDLGTAIQEANNYSSGPVTISINAGEFANSTISLSSQLIVGLNAGNTQGLTILGNGVTIDMGGADRAFFIASGAVGISNLTIENGVAAGGAGVDGGGGGAGLGGAIFVASPQAIIGTSGATSANLTLPTAVTLTNVSFSGNQAAGGNATADSSYGGGGGMGGSGGTGYFNSTEVLSFTGGGGGGGFGTGANGGAALLDDADSGASGALSLPVTGNGGGGTGGAGGADGGSDAGGGGGGSGGIINAGAGGGGGFGGGDASVNNGGNGGFGGGGGGAATDDDLSTGAAGSGGFGGGGGGTGRDGNGGFGGGGGSGSGGFGGGAGSEGQGSGGAGLGGALFVMNGASLTIVQSDTVSGTASFAGDTVSGGTGLNPGSAYGQDIFLGENVTFSVDTNLTVTSLGGAGNTADPNVADNASDPNAQGGVIKQGRGTLTLAGASYYTGTTIINTGTLVLQAGALEQGTPEVIVGQNAGDNASLVLAASSTINVGGTTNFGSIYVAEAANSIGTVIIGSGTGSSGADLGVSTIFGGSGTATLIFDENYALNSSSNTTYPFFTTLAGSLNIVQNGPGTTWLDPLYGANTFTGSITINDGVLQLGSGSALPAGNDITINGGIFDLNGFDASAGVLTVNGGTLANSSGNQSIAPVSTLTKSGLINAGIGGTGGLTQQGSGTTTIAAATSFTGTTSVLRGTLEASVQGALGGSAGVEVESDGTLVLSASDAVNSAASLRLAGGTLEIGAGLSQSLGAWLVQDDSILNFDGFGADLTFATIDVEGDLSIWNWNSLTDSIDITGAADSREPDVFFYSDSGTTFLGTGKIEDGHLEVDPVPEPSVWSLLTASLLLSLAVCVRRRAGRAGIPGV